MRKDMKTLEESTEFKPKFDDKGLITCVTIEADTGHVLMVAHMNGAALEKTLETGEMHFWSRSRGELWHKGASSGQILKLKELRVDCDQDCLLAYVTQPQEKGACHTGRHSCFYRRVSGKNTLEFIEE